MKKLITAMSVLAMVIGLAGTSLAINGTSVPGLVSTCNAPGQIHRGCNQINPQGGTINYPFDFNDTSIDDGTGANSYCGTKGNVHRAVLNLCECPQTSILQAAIPGAPPTVVGIKLEILVNGQGGDHGVYWYGTTNKDGSGSLSMTTDKVAASAMCSQTYTQPPLISTQPIMNTASAFFSGAQDFAQSGDVFAGPFFATDSNGNPQTLLSTDSTIPDGSRATILTNEGGSGGYTIQTTDKGKCTWGVDIPPMIIDYSKVAKGDTVSVRIWVWDNSSTGSLCDQGCYGDLPIGTLCCDTPAQATTLTFPYVVPTDITSPAAANWWYGMQVTNTSDTDGTFTATLYEADGDVFVLANQPLKAHTVVALSSSALMNQFVYQSGTDHILGNSRGYIVVTTNFAAKGFMAMGTLIDGMVQTTMGYVAQ